MRIIFLFFCFFCCLSLSAQINLSSLENLKPRNVGPANMSGRITAIDAYAENPKIIYVGAASGGVWKSENGGSSWKPVFDEQVTQNIGALAIQQNNPDVIWVGTGEGNPRNSMNLGMGIFKSEDGGKTWKNLGLEGTKTIHRILIDPSNTDIVYVGAMGDPFTAGEDRGLYKTIDGGKSWKKILYTNNISGVADLTMDPTNSKKLYAAMYEHERTPYYFTSGGEGSGLYVTLDGGENWKKLTEREGFPSGDLGRIGLAIAPSDPNRIYAKVEATKNALYRSDDGGNKWYIINDNPKFTNNRPFYFQELAVDSKDPDRIYNLYQPLSVSYDGGKTFDPTPMIPADETKGIHADFHAYWVNPNDPENFIIGGDGGLGITNDHGKSWYFPETIPVAQLYHVNVDNDRPYNVYAGMQDNGNWSGPGYTWKRGGVRTLYWQYLVGGDGFDVSPDAEDSRFGYGSSQNGNLYRYDKLTGYYQNIPPHAPDTDTNLRFNWNAAFARDPFDLNTIYYGSQFVHVSHDKGQTWQIISGDLTTNNKAHQKGDYGGLTLDISGAEMYNSILTIAPSSINQDVLWVGTDDGQIQLSTNKGKTWKNLTKNVKGMPKEAWIAQIEASRYHAGWALMVVNNYRKGDYKPYVFQTKDYGETWTRIVGESNVKGYALSILQDPVEENLIFLGTENGLWVSGDAGENWNQFKNGFPSVSTMDLKIQETESALIIGTFGRAIWILDDLLSLREIVAGRVKKGITALPMNDAVQVKGLFINPPGNIWSGFHTTFEGKNKVFQKTKIPFYLENTPDSTFTISAEIYNENNELINTVKKSDSLVQGLNYMIWQLDEKVAGKVEIKNDYRGIPVLPGNYSVVLDLKGSKDTTQVKVIEDPRFDIAPEVDVELYHYRKEVQLQSEKLKALLGELDTKKDLAKKIADEYKVGGYNKSNQIEKCIVQMNKELFLLRNKGQIAKPRRQVGAWQSIEQTVDTKLKEAKAVAAARTNLPSDQEKNILIECKNQINTFSKTVEDFNAKSWIEFKTKMSKINPDWFSIKK